LPLFVFIISSHITPKSAIAFYGLLDFIVYARHGRELTGWKSPVREPC